MLRVGSEQWPSFWRPLHCQRIPTRSVWRSGRRRASAHSHRLHQFYVLAAALPVPCAVGPLVRALLSDLLLGLAASGASLPSHLPAGASGGCAGGWAGGWAGGCAGGALGGVEPPARRGGMVRRCQHQPATTCSRDTAGWRQLRRAAGWSPHLLLHGRDLPEGGWPGGVGPPAGGTPGGAPGGVLPDGGAAGRAARKLSVRGGAWCQAGVES